MGAIFNELLDQYGRFRQFCADYELHTNELLTFTQNVKKRIAQRKSEQDARVCELRELLKSTTAPGVKAAAECELEELLTFPARVVECEKQEFESLLSVIDSTYEEGHACKMALCDAYEACRFELERLRDNFAADSQKISKCTAIEKSVADWELLTSAIFSEEGADNDEC